MDTAGPEGPTPDADFDALLTGVRAGSVEAHEQLAQLLGSELHGLARRMLGARPPGHTLQPTALVNEVWLKLNGTSSTVEEREHFLGLASRAMRSILVDHARRKRATKRGGEMERLPLDAVAEGVEDPDLDLVALDEALVQLRRISPRAVQIVELHFFGGAEFSEVARLLGTSESTIYREWRSARSWLHDRLSA